VGPDGALPDPEIVARGAWLERFYDLVFVASAGRFANKLGATPDLPHALSVLVWPAGLWVAWLLVTLRLNRFP
jgi:low temperature requirement protein LtrA